MVSGNNLTVRKQSDSCFKLLVYSGFLQVCLKTSLGHLLVQRLMVVREHIFIWDGKINNFTMLNKIMPFETWCICKGVKNQNLLFPLLSTFYCSVGFLVTAIERDNIKKLRWVHVCGFEWDGAGVKSWNNVKFINFKSKYKNTSSDQSISVVWLYGVLIQRGNTNILVTHY